MSTLNKMSFGFNAVQAGQKSATVNAEPRLIANSTMGKFQITSPVSKAMGIAVGDNVMFLNNIADIEAAIAQKVDALVNWAADNEVDLDTREGQEKAIDTFLVWAIAKGVPEYDAKGNPIMISERYTKEDKQAYIDEHAAEIVAANREALIARVGNPDATDEELAAAIKVEDVASPKFHKSTGSKTATTGSATGVGCQLNFTDTSIWTSLKSDLGENKDKKNRIYKVVLEGGFPVTIPNGKEDVKSVAYPIEYLEDTDPIVRNQKN